MLQAEIASYPGRANAMPDWFRLFPDEDFRFRMLLRPGDTKAFFCATDPGITAQRRQLLDASRAFYAAALPTAASAVDEARGWMNTQAGTHEIEPDWVLLAADGGHPVIAGEVCFPSAWSLPEKLGKPLAAVHEPAVTVNERLGASIDSFLQRLSGEACWERENWGLASNDRLDHHPRHGYPPPTATATLTTTWLRLESQCLARLPASGAILFAIRVTVHRLDALAAITGLAPRIARALRSMPESIAIYKGLTACRQPLAAALENARAD